MEIHKVYWSYQDLNTHAECILGRYAWPNESIFLSLNSTGGETTDEPFSLSRHHERSLYIFLFLVRVKIEWVAKHVLVCHHSLPLGVLATDICCTTCDLILPLRKEFWGTTRFSRTFCEPCCLNVRHNHIEFHGMWSSTPTSWSVHISRDVLTVWSLHDHIMLTYSFCGKVALLNMCACNCPSILKHLWVVMTNLLDGCAHSQASKCCSY
jgi:hypothetical protein